MLSKAIRYGRALPLCSKSSGSKIKRSLFAKQTFRMASEDAMQKYDPVQVALMGERCILVDENDKVTGHESKKNCTLSFLEISAIGGLQE